MKTHPDASVMNLGAALHELAQRQNFDAEHAWAAVQARLNPKPPATTQTNAPPPVRSLWQRLRRRFTFALKPTLAAE